MRAAFYYPWFPETWPAGHADHSTMGEYDSGSAAVVTSHIMQMRYARIEAGIASWWGQGSPTDMRLPLLLRLGAELGFSWCPYYEQEGYQNLTVTQIAGDLAYLLSLAVHPAWWRIDGKPVLFVYADPADGNVMAKRWVKANMGRFFLVLKVFDGYRASLFQPDGWHQYAPANPYDDQSPYSVTVSPGFHKAGESPRLARDPVRFAADVARMDASGARFQLITTMNEHGEGTAVEATEERGTTELDILKG